MAKPTKAERQKELAARARHATTQLGELRDKHAIPEEDWNEIAEHHNGIIALAQEAITGEGGARKAEGGRKKKGA